jgi:hypothetical protein
LFRAATVDIGADDFEEGCAGLAEIGGKVGGVGWFKAVAEAGEIGGGEVGAEVGDLAVVVRAIPGADVEESAVFEFEDYVGGRELGVEGLRGGTVGGPDGGLAIEVGVDGAVGGFAGEGIEAARLFVEGPEVVGFVRVVFGGLNDEGDDGDAEAEVGAEDVDVDLEGGWCRSAFRPGRLGWRRLPT